MKKFLIVFICCMAVWIDATVTTPTSRGTGLIAGKLASYASGDSIAFVYNENISGNPATPGYLIYKYSYNGGTTWNTSTVDLVYDCLTNPTLSVTPGEILVGYTKANDRKCAKSTDGGMNWSRMTMGVTFEKSPRIERRGNEYHIFELDLPYPEHLQSDFATIDDPEGLRAPQYVTDQELSWNQTPVYFHGGDVVHGSIRSNSSIWIKQTTGGTNSGWPVFNDPVITSGTINCPTTFNTASIFRGGLITNAPRIQLENTTGSFENWTVVGPPAYDPNKIVLVTGYGDHFSVHLGTITNPHQIVRDVFQQYPPGTGALGTNVITVCDTVWTLLPEHTGLGGQFQVYTKLWFRGIFGGHHSWACHDSLFIAGDITLSGTPAGAAPDNPANPNTQDSVTLIAGRNVQIKYGFKDPVTNQRVHPLVKADSSPSYIYASIFSLREDDDPRKDGTITFEYQHPHPSIPATHFQGTLYSDIDLHRYFYPQTLDNYWPAAVDLPWYNPLWPELQPYMERGILQFWGSLYQRRRGYVHRNWEDSEYYTGGIWDPSIDACGGPSFVNGSAPVDPILNLSLWPMNFPGTSGQGIGYKKDYRGDKRHEIEPELFSWGIRLGSRAASAGTFTTDHLTKYARKIHSKIFDKRGSARLFCANDRAVYELNGVFTDLSSVSGNGSVITSAVLTAENTALLSQLSPSADHYTLALREIDIQSQNLAGEELLSVDTQVNDLVVMPDGRKILVRLHDAAENYLSFEELSDEGEWELIETFPVSILDDTPESAQSRIWLLPSSNNEIEIIIWKKMPGANVENPHGTIYTAHAVMHPLAGNDPSVPVVPEVRLTALPNPMRDDLKFELELPGGTAYTVQIYNLRGQRVNILEGLSGQDGKAEAHWDGTDSTGKPCGKGIYLLKLRVPGKADMLKTICRI